VFEKCWLFVAAGRKKEGLTESRKRQGMTVHRLFKNQAFEPEALSAMTRTYAEVCRALGLNDGDHADKNGTKAVDKTRVAKMVIEFAQRGARDQRQLRDCVLQALKQ
jgi:hypothetical protein